MNRFDFLHKQYREARVKARKERILQNSQTVISANDTGTSGYRFKAGPNKDRVAGHISVKSQHRTY